MISYSTTEFGYVTSSTLSDLSGQAMTYTQCKDMCTSDPLCYGFSHQADNQHCILSESGLHAWSPSCNTCSFSQKICLPGMNFLCIIIYFYHILNALSKTVSLVIFIKYSRIQILFTYNECVELLNSKWIIKKGEM